jgi:hypothetical protein
VPGTFIPGCGPTGVGVTVVMPFPPTFGGPGWPGTDCEPGGGCAALVQLSINETRVLGHPFSDFWLVTMH